MSIEDRKKEFMNPSARYRSMPFWGWNDKLEEDELVRQIHAMKDAGVGGFFMHSRDGLETEYMGEEWFSCIKTAVKEAKSLGMYAWLYDEDRWPSGTAGGRVTREGGDDYCCKGLTLEVWKGSDFSWRTDSRVLALYRAHISGMKLTFLERIPMEKGQRRKDICLKPEESLLIARLEVSGKSEWFNHEAPPDNLNPEGVGYFIRQTHERYRELLGEEFGKTVQGIFTDEPSLADRHTAFPPDRGWIPWTYGFASFYKERRGRDPLDTIPYIYFECAGSRKARHDYWHTIAERYSESYSRQIGAWCEEAGIIYTGHFLQEDKLGLCTRVNGSIMPHYQYQRVPGIDMLGERTEEYLTVKQCTSVANQFDKPRVLSETYGCTGWEFTMEGQKWMGDWQFVLGVNLRCQHLSLYSIHGCRKRDYPPCFNYNTSWWHKNRVVEDYFARLSSVLSQGRPIRRVLLMHPHTTAWSRLGTNPYGNSVRRDERDVPEIDEYGYEYNRLIEYLVRSHYDLDLGDEMLLESSGKAENGTLQVNHAIYQAVILPPMDTLLHSTFQLLFAYVEQGGILILMEPCPFCLDGEESEKIRELTDHPEVRHAACREEARGILESLINRDVSLINQKGEEEENLLYLLKEDCRDLSLFLVNNNREQSAEAELYLPYPEARLEEWNPLTGNITPVAAEKTSEGIKLPVSFGPAGSRLYRILIPKEPEKRILSPISIKPDRENSFTLDRTRYRIEGGGWSEEMEIWQAQSQIREKLGMRQIYANGLEQRYRWIYEEHKKNRTQVELEYTFHSKDDISIAPVWLVLEFAGHYQIFINDKECRQKPEGWFLDRSFQKVLLQNLKPGENRIRTVISYQNSTELENCYLIGSFGVNLDRRLYNNPVLSIGDWTKQGYLHYIGSMTYQFLLNLEAFQKVILDMSKFQGVCAAAVINGAVLEIPWRAEGIQDITHMVAAGDNYIEITVTGSPRNMLGPFHLKEGKRVITNDSCFTVTGEEYGKEYCTVPYGLMEAPVCFIS